MKKLIILLCALGLVGCRHHLDYMYLMQHPHELEQEIKHCEDIAKQPGAKAGQCEMVMYAGANFKSILDEQQADQEKFGQQVLDAQIRYVKLKDAVSGQEKILHDLRVSKAPDNEIASAQAKLDDAKKDAQTLHDKINIMLAVIGVNSPE